jgi:hypothetical protein
LPTIWQWWWWGWLRILYFHMFNIVKFGKIYLWTNCHLGNNITKLKKKKKKQKKQKNWVQLGELWLYWVHHNLIWLHCKIWRKKRVNLCYFKIKIMQLFIYLFIPILWRSHIGNQPQKELAKFGYGAQRKIEKNLKKIAIFLATCWNLLSRYGDLI